MDDEGGCTLTSQVDHQAGIATTKGGLLIYRAWRQKLAFGFLKPNILRTVLYNETTSSDKVARMERAARNTTSLETDV